LTPEAERDFRDLVEEGTMPPKRRALLRAVMEELRDREAQNLQMMKLLTLEKTLRVIVEDEDYECGGLSHHGSCAPNHSWGPEEVPCDCYVRHVTAALKALEDPDRPKDLGEDPQQTH
jgi:hypothetical protein